MENGPKAFLERSILFILPNISIFCYDSDNYEGSCMAYRWFVVGRILFSLVYNAFYEKVRTRMVEGCC